MDCRKISEYANCILTAYADLTELDISGLTIQEYLLARKQAVFEIESGVKENTGRLEKTQSRPRQIERPVKKSHETIEDSIPYELPPTNDNSKKHDSKTSVKKRVVHSADDMKNMVDILNSIAD